MRHVLRCLPKLKLQLNSCIKQNSKVGPFLFYTCEPPSSPSSKKQSQQARLWSCHLTSLSPAIRHGMSSQPESRRVLNVWRKYVWWMYVLQITMQQMSNKCILWTLDECVWMIATCSTEACTLKELSEHISQMDITRPSQTCVECVADVLWTFHKRLLSIHVPHVCKMYFVDNLWMYIYDCNMFNWSVAFKETFDKHFPNRHYTRLLHVWHTCCEHSTNVFMPSMCHTFGTRILWTIFECMHMIVTCSYEVWPLKKRLANISHTGNTNVCCMFGTHAVNILQTSSCHPSATRLADVFCGQSLNAC